MFRKYVNDKNDSPPFSYRAWKFILLGSLIFLIYRYLNGMYSSYQFIQQIINVVKFFLFLIAIIIFITGIIGSLFLFNYVVYQPKIPKMNLKSSLVAKRIRYKITSRDVIENLKLSVLTKNHGYAMPVIKVYIDNDLTSGSIYIENFGQYEKLNRDVLDKSISGLLRGKFSKYSVTSQNISLGGNYLVFNFEDTKTSHRFYVHNNDLSPFLSSDKHSIRLSDDLTWDALKTPHMAIIARTGSGKTVFAGWYIARLARLQNWKVIYNSGKHDRMVDEFGGKSEPVEIVESAERLVSIMQERLFQIQKSSKDDYSQMSGMVDIIAIFDEIGFLNAQLESDKKLKMRWETAMRSLAMIGRSTGIHLVGISQFASIESFLPNAVRVNMKEAVIMLGESANNNDEKRFMIPGFTEKGDRHYAVGEGIAMVSTAGKKWTSPHFFETPLFVD